LFCHVTVVPFETVSVLGLKDMFIMVTVLDCAGGGFCDEVDVLYGLLESLLQPKSPANEAPKSSDADQLCLLAIASPRYSVISSYKYSTSPAAPEFHCHITLEDAVFHTGSYCTKSAKTSLENHPFHIGKSVAIFSLDFALKSCFLVSVLHPSISILS
jgi:hypothetical protein